MVSLNETYLKQWQDEDLEHLRYEYDVREGEQVLDIGSYQHEWGNEMIKRYKCKVESFDALDNKAAWKFNGKIRTGGAYYYTSMFEKPTHEYWCVDIAPYIQTEIAVCKINIEGAEYELIKYIIDKGLMPNIRNLQVQFHLVERLSCDLLYKEISRRLELTHDIEWRYPFVWESWRRRSVTDTTFKTDNLTTKTC